MQSNTVSDGRGDGKRAIRGLPRTLERRVVLGAGVRGISVAYTITRQTPEKPTNTNHPATLMRDR